MAEYKLETYRLKSYDYGNNEMFEDITLPDNIKWFVDKELDGMMHRGCRNYTAFIRLSDYDDNAISELEDNVFLVKMGEYALLYINNKVFDGAHPKFTKKLDIPVIDILSWNNSSYKFESVIRPLEYLGGGDFKCLMYYRNVFSFSWEVSIEMCSVYLASPYSRSTVRSYNGKFVKAYKDAIGDMLFNGGTNVDLDILNGMFQDPDMDAVVFDRVLKGNELHYTDGRIEK